ncbi:MAG: FkbM family methyltransferase [Paracoccaceae bacterium]
METLKQTSDALGKDVTPVRGGLNQTLWQAQQALGLVPRYFSAAGQDMLVDQHVFVEKRGGVFLDIGCADGALGSNTLFLEVFRGWNGLLIDARAAAVVAARDCRRAPVVQAVIGHSGQEAEFLEATGNLQQMSGLSATLNEAKRDILHNSEDVTLTTSTVRCVSINDILAEHGIGAIDFVSLDIEGGELDVLREFDFKAHPVRAWAIENSQHGDELQKFMSDKGYALVDYLGEDEIYVDPETQTALVERMNEG